MSVSGLSSSLFYLVSYQFTTIGAFAVITLIRDAGCEAGHLSGGVRPTAPAGMFAVFLPMFADIPLTSGFTGNSC